VTGAESERAEWDAAHALADMLAARADDMDADGYGTLAAAFRADARRLRAEAWRAVGYG
jgi:hypothetical protein